MTDAGTGRNGHQPDRVIDMTGDMKKWAFCLHHSDVLGNAVSRAACFSPEKIGETGVTKRGQRS